MIVVLILLIGNCTYILKDLTLENDFVLEKSLVFKSENEYIILSENLVLVYTGEANGGELKKAWNRFWKWYWSVTWGKW